MFVLTSVICPFFEISDIKILQTYDNAQGLSVSSVQGRTLKNLKHPILLYLSFQVTILKHEMIDNNSSTVSKVSKLTIQLQYI